jgi:hypothetical protein
MAKLSDGTIIPSTLSVKPNQTAQSSIFNNFSLKQGVVTDIFYPEDDHNLSKKFIEYNVLVSEVNSNGNVTMSSYRNCTIQNMFGMSNNNCTYTLQADNEDDATMKYGSMALILCMSGQSTNGQAVIVGGYSHTDNPKYSKEDGQFYDFNFNGINYNINKDGEWTLTFNSPIDKDGKKADEKAAGTKIKIDKEGKVSISDNEGQSWSLDRVAKTSTWTNGAESILINKENKSISLTSSGELSASSEKAMSLSSGDALSAISKSDMTVSAGSNLNIDAKSSITAKSGGSWKIQATGSVDVKGTVITIKADTIAKIQGSITQLGSTGALPVALVGMSQCVGVVTIPGTLMTSMIISGSAEVFGS